MSPNCAKFYVMRKVSRAPSGGETSLFMGGGERRSQPQDRIRASCIVQRCDNARHICVPEATVPLRSRPRVIYAVRGNFAVSHSEARIMAHNNATSGVDRNTVKCTLFVLGLDDCMIFANLCIAFSCALAHAAPAIIINHFCRVYTI